MGRDDIASKRPNPIGNLSVCGKDSTWKREKFDERPADLHKDTPRHFARGGSSGVAPQRRRKVPDRDLPPTLESPKGYLAQPRSDGARPSKWKGAGEKSDRMQRRELEPLADRTERGSGHRSARPNLPREPAGQSASQTAELEGE